MGGLRVDVAGVDSEGSAVSAAGQAPSPLVAAATPVANDPVSVAVALTLGARAAAVHGHSTQAAAVTTARGQQLIGDGAAYSEGEAANAALLGSGGDGAAGAGGATPATPNATAIAPAAIPAITAPVLPALPADGKTIATLIHGGGDGAGLKATAEWVASHPDHQATTATSLHGAAAGLEADWASAAATAATGRVRELGTWHDEHATHASSAAQAIHDHLAAYATAKAAIPTVEAFDDNERRLRQAVAANNHPLALGRYTGVINELVAQRAQLNADAVKGYNTYAASAGNQLTGDPMTPAPQPTTVDQLLNRLAGGPDADNPDPDTLLGQLAAPRPSTAPVAGTAPKGPAWAFGNDAEPASASDILKAFLGDRTDWILGAGGSGSTAITNGVAGLTRKGGPENAWVAKAVEDIKLFGTEATGSRISLMPNLAFAGASFAKDVGQDHMPPVHAFLRETMAMAAGTAATAPLEASLLGIPLAPVVGTAVSNVTAKTMDLFYYMGKGVEDIGGAGEAMKIGRWGR